MEKTECKAVVELLSVTWDKSLDTASLTVRAKGYWEFIHDLPYEETKTTIKRMGMAGRKWLPKPGELRLATLSYMNGEELPPEPEEAWTILQAIGKRFTAALTTT